MEVAQPGLLRWQWKLLRLAHATKPEVLSGVNYPRQSIIVKLRLAISGPGPGPGLRVAVSRASFLCVLRLPVSRSGYRIIKFKSKMDWESGWPAMTLPEHQ